MRLPGVLVLLLLLAVPPGIVEAQSALPGGAVTLALDRDPPNYLEGDKVRIRVGGGGAEISTMQVRVSCGDCPDRSRTFRAAAREELVFPDDFGPDARAEVQPRWNGTWWVELATSAGGVVQARPFHVWLFTAYRFAENTVVATGLVDIHASGLEPGDRAQITVRARRADGGFTVVFVEDVPVTADGIAIHRWVLRKQDAERLHCPGRPAGYCELHEMTVKGAGKEDELVRFRVRPAHVGLTVTEGVGPNGVPAPIERTDNATVGLIVRYPNNQVVAPEDLQSVRNPSGRLKFAVEKFADGQTEPQRVANVSAEWVPETFRWRATWTLPRNLSVPSEDYYRLTLLEQKDRYGNFIDEVPLSNFTAASAVLEPVFVSTPAVVERLDEAKTVLALRYHDGSPLEPGDNVTALRGCYVRDDPGPASCERGFAASAAYAGGGLWNFTYRFPRDYPDLSEHRFLFEGGASARDRWGNVFLGELSDAAFEVVVARLRVDLVTAVGGQVRNETRGFDRGDRIQITATITYPDGTPFSPAEAQNAADRIPVTIVKTAGGVVAGTESVDLVSLGHGSPHWTASYAVSRSADLAPSGPWELRFEARDNLTPPNQNESVFMRPVNVTIIRVVPTEQPPVRAVIGSEVPYRFRLVYADGTSVRANDLAAGFRVDVIRASGRFVGAVVGDPLEPTYDPGRDEWSVTWIVPRTLFAGTFELGPRGVDRHGNVIDPNARSRGVTTFTESRVRAVLTEPPSTVPRTEAVVAVFDGREGDIHHTGFPGSRPAIEVQRLDGATGQWVVERRNVREGGADQGDHVGRFNTTVTTTLGVYRMMLRGRDSTFNLINATSEPFTIVPTNVTRALIVPPPERVAKGQYLTWALEREAGDTVLATRVLLDGAAATAENLLGNPVLAGPIYQVGEDRFNFTWRVPYAAKSAEYSFQVTGRDAYGNTIAVDVPPVAAEPSVLAGQILGNPERLQRRGLDVKLLFAITYPNGDYFLAKGTPSVVVRNASGVVDRATVTYTGTVYEARWRPPLEAGLADYWFEVTGQDETGNVFPALRSAEFKLAPGAYDRKFSRDAGASLLRMQEMRVELPADADDVFVAFSLGYVSDATQMTEAILGARRATAVATLEHSVDRETGRYIVKWKADRDEKPGIYVIMASGLDAAGNEFRAQTSPVLVKTIDLVADFDALADDALAAGTELTVAFTVRYAAAQPPTVNALVDPATVYPEATMLYQGQPIAEPRPDVAYDPAIGKWVAEWPAPDVLPNGDYTLVVQGQDDAGNVILARQSQPLTIDTPVVSSLFKVLKVPDVGPAIAVLAIALLASVLGRRARAPPQ